MTTRHIAAEHADARDLTPDGSGGGALKRFRRRLAADGFTTDEGWRPRPGYLYTVVRAISARVNQNYDGWPSDELKKSYKTFIGKPVFVNHENHDPTKARGVVVAARYVENGPDRYIETVMEVDAGRFPKLAHEIKTGGLDSVSMGAEAGFTICSYCHNKATDLDDMCDHVRNHKGKTLTRFDKRTGKKEDILVFESCHKISFFELSYVFEPADETAVASKVVVAGLDKRSSSHTATPTDDYPQWMAEHGEEADREGTHGIGVRFPSWEQKRWLHDQDVLQRRLDFTARVEIEAMMRAADAGSPILENSGAANAAPQASSSSSGDSGLAQGAMAGTALGVGSAREQAAEGVAKSNAGKPYEFGGSGPGSTNAKGQPANSFDCTGLVGDEMKALNGQPTGGAELKDTSGNRFNTTSDMGKMGFEPGYEKGNFNIGLNPNPGASGHVVTEFPSGQRSESSGKGGVQYGPSARSVFDPMFTQQWHLPDVTKTIFDTLNKQSALADLREIHALMHTAGECPPGMDCSMRVPGLEQITKDSPNNPVNQPTADPNGTGGRGGKGGTAGSSPSNFDISQWKSADDYAKAMNGKPYEYGGGGGTGNSVDCSGFMSNLYSIYSGKPTRFTTDSNFADLGFRPGFKPGAFNIGTNGGVGPNGHMAGTLPDGTNVESNGSDGVRYGGGAAGATDNQFSQQWHYEPPGTAASPATTPSATTALPTQRAAGKRTAADDYSASWSNGVLTYSIGDKNDSYKVKKAPTHVVMGDGSEYSPSGLWATTHSSRELATKARDRRGEGKVVEVKQSSLRAAGKYTKEDFAIADGKKPWERETPKRAPVPDDDESAVKEIEAMMGIRRRSSLADDYMDYMYGEYGGTDWDIPNSPMDIMYDEADHGRGRTGPRSGPSGPGGPALRHSRKTAANNMDGLLFRLAGGEFDSGWSSNDPGVLDEVDPDSAEEEIPDEPGGFANGWESYKGRELDPEQEVYSHLNLHAVRQGLPGIWSFSQKVRVPHEDTGKMITKRLVVGYAPDAHLRDARMHVDKAAAAKYHQAMQEHLADPENIPAPKRTVHAGVIGYLTGPPQKPLSYSGIEYHPGDVYGSFVHRDNKEPVHTADTVHLAPDKRMYGFQADNWGRDHAPQLVVDPHPNVNASNRETVWPPLDKQAMTREAAINELYLGGPDPANRRAITAALKKTARRRALKLAWGETEAPMAVDTLREEGSAPEDDNNDDQRYVDPADSPFANNISSPAELQAPDLSQASQIDREQEIAGQDTTGVPGPAEGGPPPAEQGNFITLKIPMPSPAPQVPAQAGPPVAMPPPAAPAGPPAPQPQQAPAPVTAALLDYFDNYYGRRVANWLDAIEANRAFTPAEAADYRRQTEKLSTLENGRELSTTDRNPRKGTANMARSSIANRGKVATAGRRQHFAEGPLVDGGDRSRNDQGEQEEVFISQTPPEEGVVAPTDDTNISNTEHNLVARVQRGRDQLLRDAQALASLRQRRAFDEAGGPTAEVVDPRVNSGPEAEALTGTDFISADPNDGVVPTNPKDASLRAFQAFDGWLSAKTGKSSRRHTEATIKQAAAQFSREAGISPQALFPALGIVLREARKNDKQANTKGAKMRKRADEKLEVAAPDGRVDVEAPVSNTTDAEAQASQFDLHDFGNNAGDNVADPDLSTDQNWAPGEASKTGARVKTAGGLLAMRCAEGMIAAGLEPNSRERKYQLAAEFETMNRGLIQDRVALLERFAAVRQAERRKVASGGSRGAARSPIPAGLGSGSRTASVPMQRMAAHDPSNDSTLFI